MSRRFGQKHKFALLPRNGLSADQLLLLPTAAECTRGIALGASALPQPPRQ